MATNRAVAGRMMTTCYLLVNSHRDCNMGRKACSRRVDGRAVPPGRGRHPGISQYIYTIVRFEADTGEVEFEESSDLSIAVAERVLPSWARAARLTCVRAAGDSLESADGGLVVVAQERRVAVDEQLFVVRIGEALVVKRFSAGRRSVEPSQ